MTDLRDILDSATGEHAAPPPDVVRDDLVRGRRALVRRRRARASAAAAGAAAVVAAAVVVGPGVTGVLGGDSPQTVHVAAPAANPGVPLVAFDAGPTPKPISPGLVPQGWSVSGNEFALVIAAPGDATSPDDFRGKLVVYVDQGVPGEPLPRAHEVAVGDRTGYAIREDKSALQVWVPQDDGTTLRAQAPPALGWDEATLGEFLGAVTVSDQAQAGVG